MGRPSQLGQAKPSRVGPKSSHKTGSLKGVAKPAQPLGLGWNRSSPPQSLIMCRTWTITVHVLHATERLQKL